jgi:ribonucleoside-diphosphate reductase alpha chain
MDIYIEAWKHGLKGITVFREGCKRAAILSTDSHKEEVVEDFELPRGYVIETSDKLVGKKRKLITGCGSLHVTAFFDPKTGDLMETYLSKGSTGGCANSLTGLSRMISLAARAGVGIQAIVDQLDSSGACPSYAVRRATKKDTSKGSCCPMAVGNALIEMWKEVQNETHTFSEEVCEETHTFSKEKCPQCNEPLVNEGGCTSCKACGWSKCDL